MKWQSGGREEPCNSSYPDRNREDECRIKVRRTLKVYFTHFEFLPRICKKDSPFGHDTVGTQLFTACLAFSGPVKDQGHLD